METEPLPAWMMRRYAQIWKLKRDQEFTANGICDELKEDKKVMLVLLSNWRKKGWLTVEFDKNDARKRVYQLKPPEQVVEAMTA